MFDAIKDLYHTLITEPILNLIQLFFNWTGDTGWAIVLTGVLVNLAIWPLFAKSYINSQKMRLLQPELKKIQEKYKGKPQELYQKTREFYQKHDIKNGTTFLVLILQILIFTGLYFTIRNIVNGSEDQISAEVYGFISENTKPSFNHTAFGSLDITKSAAEYKYIFPLIITVLTYLTGMYNFRWGPKPKLRKTKKTDKKDSMAESLQKTLEFQSIYVFPAIFLFINISFPTGINLYFLTSSSIGLIRQIFLSNFYTKNTDKLLDDITKSDPTSKDNDPSNNLEITAKADQIADQEIATKVVDTKSKKKKSTKKKKGSKKKK